MVELRFEQAHDFVKGHVPYVYFGKASGERLSGKDKDWKNCKCSGTSRRGEGVPLFRLQGKV